MYIAIMNKRKRRREGEDERLLIFWEKQLGVDYAEETGGKVLLAVGTRGGGR